MNDGDKAQQERHARLIEQMRRILGSEICAVFDDPKAVEIMLNDDGRVLVERHGAGITHLTNLPVAKTLNFLSLMADFRGTTITRERPIVEGAMPDEFLRARFAGAIPPLMPQPTFAIRLPARQVYTLEDYRESGILTGQQYDQIVAAIEGRKNILVSGGTGCFAKGHPILMFDGNTKAVQDVQVGDLVMGPDSQPRKVKDVHTGLDVMVKVIPYKGESFVVNQGHRLALVETHKATRRKLTKSVIEWTLACDKFRHNHKLYQASPITAWTRKDLPLSPYFLGVFLGDGSAIGCVSISKPDSEIRQVVNDVADEFGLHVNTYWRSANSPTYRISTNLGQKNRLIGILRSLGLYGVLGAQRFVPAIYKTSSLQQRLELLAGLLDTDGHLNGNSFDFVSKSQQLARDVQWLARSCGLHASLSECEKSCQGGFTGAYWRVYIGGNLSIIPTRIARKVSSKETDYVISGIKSIETLGVGAYYGFEVDHPDHLFVDGHFRVQGNSGKTTAVNACSDYISRISGLDQRIVIIEDTREIVCNAPNTLSMLTDEDTGIDMTRLLKLTLRYRPDRIFVGEVRDKAALALLKAWNTGHPGGLATLHANDPEAALIRLDQLCQEAGVPPQKELIRESVDVVIQITKDAAHPAGRRISDILFLHDEVYK